MKVISRPISSAALALLLMGSGFVAAQEQPAGKASPAERVAKRAAVAAHAKEKLQVQDLAQDQLQKLQDVGKALLASQSTLRPDPADEALRQEMKALRADIDQALLQMDVARYELVTHTESSETLQSSPETLPKTVAEMARGADGKLSLRALRSADAPGASLAVPDRKAQRSASTITAADPYAPVRARLGNLKLRASAAATAADDVGRKRTSTQRARTKHLVTKADEVRSAVNTAIAAKPGRESRAALVALRERLEEKKRPELSGVPQAGDSSVPAPTLTTIVRHR